MQPIKFGTDGWRGIIAEDYTLVNVRRAASAIANYVLKNEDSRRGVAIGYDTRFGSRMFAQAVAEVFAAAGVDVRLSNDYTPTPALSFGVKHFGAAGAVMITSSHNPFNWNGVKYKASYGGRTRARVAAGTGGGRHRGDARTTHTSDAARARSALGRSADARLCLQGHRDGARPRPRGPGLRCLVPARKRRLRLDAFCRH